MNQPPTACRTQGCGGYVVERGLCGNCAKENPATEQAKRLSAYDANRVWKHLYDGGRWRHPVRGLRAATLRKFPVCTKCGVAPATIADHVIPHKGNLALFYDFNNLTGLCSACHHDKTAAGK